MEQPEQEICSIKIMFPVQSDEQAFECKKKIQLALSDIKDTQIDFRVISGRLLTANGPPR